MELIKGSFYIEWNSVSVSLKAELVSNYRSVGAERKNGMELMMKEYDGVYLLNPLVPRICETTGLMDRIKPRVLIQIDDDEYVMGVAGKELKEVVSFNGARRYWIVEKFVRMEYDDFSYRIFKHSVMRNTDIDPFGFILEEKELYESNWDGYPRNIVLKRMVEKIEGELIARAID